MKDRYKEPFENPYVDESANEARFSSVVTMDEIQERWRTGAWVPDDDAFELPPSLTGRDASDTADGKKDAAAQEGAPENNRFAFDLKKDVIYADDGFREPSDNPYTDSYRPRGDIGSNISNLTLDRLRYNALAGVQEELPDDLSYLYGEGDRRRTERREPPKDRLYNRLGAPVEKRRAKVEQMIPEREGESPEKIMAEVKKRRAIEDAKAGIVRQPTVKRRAGIYDAYGAPGSFDEFKDFDGQDIYPVERLSASGSWRSNLPEQDGLVPDSRAVPYFGRFSRTWSKIESPNPTRSEMLRHTVNTIYNEDGSENEERHESGRSRFRANGKERREYYVDDMDFDPDDRYRRLRRKRRAVTASKNVLTEDIMAGKFNNPYVEVSDDRLRDIINHDMRGPGQLADPEGLTDPALLHEWNMGYSRVNNDENKYAEWFEQQSRLAEHAEQSRYRGSHRSGRPGAYLQRERPYGEERRYPGGEYRERETRRRDMQEQMQRATEKGIADGEEIIRRRRDAERQAEEARLEEERLAKERQQEYFRQQHEEMLRQQEEYFRRQHEDMLRQQEKIRAQQQSYYQQQEDARRQQAAAQKKQQDEMRRRQQAYYQQQQEYARRQQEYFRQMQQQAAAGQGQRQGPMPSVPNGYPQGQMPSMPNGYPQGQMPSMPNGYPQGNMPSMPNGYPQGQMPPMPNGYPQSNMPPMPNGYPQGSRR